MNSSIELIFKKYPDVKKKFQNRDVELSINQESVFYDLALFMSNPKKYSFNLSLLYQYLEDDELVFALEVIGHFFKYNTYLIKENTNLLIKDSREIKLYNQKMLAEFLTQNGYKFSPQKVNTYVSRGLIPQGDISVGGVPYWLEETVIHYLNSLKESKKS